MIYLQLLGGFVLCLGLGTAVPFLRLRRKPLKLLALAIPLFVLVVIVAGQGMTNRYWVAIVPYILALAALGTDVVRTIRGKEWRELPFQAATTVGCAWSGFISLLAMDSCFMGACC